MTRRQYLERDAVRTRRRIRRKIGDERYEVIFGPIERASAKAVAQDEKAVAVEAEVLPVAKAGKQEGKKEKMKFGYAVSSCFRKMFTFSGRARRGTVGENEYGADPVRIIG